MDEETHNLLESWEFLELVETFRDNLIDIKALQELNEDDLRAMIKPIGLLAKFRVKWKSWLDSVRAPNTSTPARNAAEFSNQSSFEEDFHLLEEISDSLNTGTVQDDTQGLPKKQLGLNTKDSLDFREKDAEQDRHLDYLIAFNPDFVKDTLDESVEGQGIAVADQLSSGLLTASQRKDLGRLLVRKILQKNANEKINGVTFARLALQISKMFPKEAAALYYVPNSYYINQKKVNASGILYECYVSLRRKLRKLGVLPRSISSSTTSKSSVKDEPTRSETFCAFEAEALNWLNNCIEPWPMVCEYWKTTEKCRILALQDKGNLEEYFDKYPALKTHEGYKLLLQDFSYLYPEKEQFLFSNLLNFKDKLVRLANDKIKNSKDHKELKLIISQYLAIATDSSRATHLLATLLLVIPLLNHKPTCRKGGNVYKPSKIELNEEFITFLAQENDIPTLIEERKRKYERYGITFQPLVVLVGDVKEVKSSKVVVDKTIYSFPSPIEAVDACFKIVHATNACYQEEVDTVWLFIQRVFYQLATKYDRINQSVRHLLNDLEISI